MTLSRSARYGLLLTLLLLVAAGAYLYRNLDTLLQRQLQLALEDVGVQEQRLHRPRLQIDSLTADAVWLRGHYQQHDFELSMAALRVTYDWRSLLTGRVQSVSLSNLELSLRRTGAASPPAAAREPLEIDIASVLPRELLGKLPAESLAIESLRIDYRGPDYPDLTLTGALSYGEQLAVSLAGTLAGGAIALQLLSTNHTPSIDAAVELLDGDIPAAQLSLQLTPLDPGEWAWHLAGTWDSGPLLAWLSRLTAVTGTASADSFPGRLSLSGPGWFDLQLRHPGHFTIREGDLWPQLQTLEATARLESRFADLAIPGIISSGNEPAPPVLAMSWGVTLAAGQLEFRLLPLSAHGRLAREFLPIDGETLHWLQWGQHVPLELALQQPLVIGFDGKQWTGQLEAASITLGNVHSRAAVDDLQIAASYTTGDRPLASVELATQVTSTLRGQPLPPLELALAQQGPLQESSVQLELTAPGDSLEAGLDGLIDLRRKRGALELSVESTDLRGLSSAFVPPLRALGVLDGELVIETGSLELETQLTGTDRWNQTSQFELTGVSGQYDTYRFDGMSFAAGWSGLENWQTTTPATFALENLDAGFDISRISAGFSLPRPTPATRPAVVIGSFSATLFGGRVFLPETATWDFGAASNSLTLRAEQWQLGQIVALQQNEDISAKGILEGELPVTIADGRIVIDEGYLRAVPPGGTIRYSADGTGRALGQNSKELELAMSLLSDFRFDVLRSAVDLDESGNLLLGLSLSGRNPDRYDGRLVNFNINLEQNLDPLLQSLRLGGNLSQEIEKRLR